MKTHKRGISQNTTIHYLYRDADNYKVHNFATIEGILTEEQQRIILGCLESDNTFIPNLVGLPEEKFSNEDPEVDHPWFELYPDDFTTTSAPPDLHLNAEQLVANFLAQKGKWEADEEPMDPKPVESGHSVYDRLLEKVHQEQNRYRKKMLSELPAEIYNHAYEIGLREDIVFLLDENLDSSTDPAVLADWIPTEQAEALCQIENLLNEVVTRIENSHDYEADREEISIVFREIAKSANP